MLGLWQEAIIAGRDGGHAHALLVAHRGVIRAVVHRLTGGREPHIDLGSIQILELKPGGDTDLRSARWRPVALDLTEHLEAL
jgi:broad specificity phosphatase PhoE